MSEPCSHIILDRNSFTIDNIKHGFVVILEHPNQLKLPKNVQLSNKSLLLCGGASFGVKSFDYGLNEPALMENDLLIPLHSSMVSNYQKFVSSLTVDDLLQCHDVANVKIGGLLSKNKSERCYLENEIRNLQLLSNGIRIDTYPAISYPNAHLAQYKEVVAYTTIDLRSQDKAVKNSMKIFHDQGFEETIRRQLSCCIEETGNEFKRLTIVMRHGILRIPNNFKLVIQELEVSDNANEVINSIKNIIDDKSFPLKLLSIQTTMADDPVFQNEVLRTAKALKIIAHGHVTGNWGALLKHLPQEEVLFVTEQVTCQFVADIANILHDNPRKKDYNIYIQCNHVGDVMTSIKPFIHAVNDDLVRYVNSGTSDRVQVVRAFSDSPSFLLSLPQESINRQCCIFMKGHLSIMKKNSINWMANPG
ncbi:hypothetical protein CAEBREN_05195 [Caenorhabditis brenneri]|uniref:Uncharacterized protein n=1 Tax=Caenorhabditis brenneri TaxID=135651 RepID=G0N468_CAEBE|nr:hypothetical protein CAEBREN_05195 [Caenorhabditis brenneri]